MLAESSTLDIEIGPELVELRLAGAAIGADRPDLGSDALDRLDGLRLNDNPQAYGSGLMRSIVRGQVAQGYDHARKSVRIDSEILRIRLRIDASDTRLRALWWEGVVDEQSALKWPSTYNGTPFSRYLGDDCERRRSRTDGIKVLAAISNPYQLGQIGDWSNLPSLDQKEEEATVQAALASLDPRQYAVLTTPASSVEIESLLTVGRAKDGLKGFHVLHIVAPAYLEPSDGLAYLLLEDDSERALPFSEDQLVQLVMNARDLQLVILAGTHSAAAADGPALVRLATRLVEVGLPAAIAMQDRLPSDASGRFLDRLYRLLALSVSDGEPIDRAVNQARNALQNAVTPRGWGWLLPVLFMRGDGRLFEPIPEALTSPAPSPFGSPSVPQTASAPQSTTMPDPKAGSVPERAIRSLFGELASKSPELNIFFGSVNNNKGVDMSKQEINATNSQINAPTDNATVSSPMMTVNAVPFDQSELNSLLEQLIAQLQAASAEDPRLGQAAGQLDIARAQNAAGEPPEKFKDRIEDAGKFIESADATVTKGLKLGETLAKVAGMVGVALPWIARALGA